jgi:putative spermidine/putrescine transport system substrate-binding protein
VRDIKDNIVWWTSFSDSAQLLRDGEATMGILVTSRAVPLRRDTKNRIQLSYEQGIYYASAWSILKGNPAGKKAQEFIAATQDPAAQVEFLRLLGNGPINPAANALVTPELQEINPSAPEHLSKMIVGDNDWYAANEAKVLQRFFDEVILA